MKKSTKELLFERMHTIGGMPLKEEYENGQLYGYHVTPIKNLDSIEKTGLKMGDASMQGKGLYGFYFLDDKNLSKYKTNGLYATYYATKSYNDTAIIKFGVNKHSILIFHPEIAKDVLGQNYMIVDQLKNMIGGADVIKNSATMMGMDIPSFEDTINEKFLDYSSRFQMSHLVSDYQKLGNGWLFDGEYGLTYVIHEPQNLKLYEYYIHNGNTRELSDPMQFKSVASSVYEKGEYPTLKTNDFRITDEMDIYRHQQKIEDIQSKVRNNREYDLYQKVLDELDKLEYDLKNQRFSSTNKIDKRGIA